MVLPDILIDINPSIRTGLWIDRNIMLQLDLRWCMEPKSKDSRNKVRRWTFNVASSKGSEKVAAIPIPGFTIGSKAAAQQAADQILSMYNTEEAKREPVESNRFKFRVELMGHETVNHELFEKFIELQNKEKDGRKQSETYRGLLMIACKELSERHPIEMGKPENVFTLLLKKFHALSKGKDPNAKIELISPETAARLGIK